MTHFASHSPRLFAALATGLLLLGVLAACGAPPGDTPHETPNRAEKAEIRVASLKEVRDAMKEPGAPLIVNFWATWCIPCLQEMPDLLAGTRAFREGGGRLIGIALERTPPDGSVDSIMSEVTKVAQRLKLDFPILICTEDDLLEVRRVLNLDLGGLPQTFGYDRKGSLVVHHEGTATQLEFQHIAEEIAAAK